MKTSDADITTPMLPAIDETTADDVHSGLPQPPQLDTTARRSSSDGAEAAQYHARPHTPPARLKHEATPGDPVIVSQTHPGVAPPATPLNVTPEERQRLEEELAYHRRLLEQELDARRLQPGDPRVDTHPTRRQDPPAIETRPAKAGGAFPKIGLALILLLLVVGVFGAVAMRASRHGSVARTPATSTETAALPTRLPALTPRASSSRDPTSQPLVPATALHH